MLLLDGAVYITWASFGDNGPYNGCIIGYSAKTLKQVAVFNDTPDGSAGGIGMSGAGPPADTSHNIYAATGNGSFNANATGGSNFRTTILHLSAPNLLPLPHFSPH